MPEWDFAITANRHSEGMLLHKIDCPQVIASRQAGGFIGTLYGCGSIPDIERCECLENVEIARSAAG